MITLYSQVYTYTWVCGILRIMKMYRCYCFTLLRRGLHACVCARALRSDLNRIRNSKKSFRRYIFYNRNFILNFTIFSRTQYNFFRDDCMVGMVVVEHKFHFEYIKYNIIARPHTPFWISQNIIFIPVNNNDAIYDSVMTYFSLSLSFDYLSILVPRIRAFLND